MDAKDVIPWATFRRSAGVARLAWNLGGWRSQFAAEAEFTEE